MCSNKVSVYIGQKEKGQQYQRLLRNAKLEVNEGFSYFELDNRVIDKGSILMEPVNATIAFAGRPVAVVNILD